MLYRHSPKLSLKLHCLAVSWARRFYFYCWNVANLFPSKLISASILLIESKQRLKIKLKLDLIVTSLLIFSVCSLPFVMNHYIVCFLLQNVELNSFIHLSWELISRISIAIMSVNDIILWWILSSYDLSVGRCFHSIAEQIETSNQKWSQRIKYAINLWMMKAT